MIVAVTTRTPITDRVFSTTSLFVTVITSRNNKRDIVAIRYTTHTRSMFNLLGVRVIVRVLIVATIFIYTRTGFYSDPFASRRIRLDGRLHVTQSDGIVARRFAKHHRHGFGSVPRRIERRWNENAPRQLRIYTRRERRTFRSPDSRRDRGPRLTTILRNRTVYTHVFRVKH